MSPPAGCWTSCLVETRRALSVARRPQRGVASADPLGDAGLSGPYRAVFDTMLPDAVQIADPFHLVKLANSKLDECRRRVQNETLGHRGRKHDPLYRARRLLTRADERLDDRRARPSCSACSTPATPAARSAPPGTPRKSSGRSTTTPTPTSPSSSSSASATTCRTSPARPRSARSAARCSAGRTRSPPGTRPTSRNGPTEAVNNLIKRVKRVAFGFTRFRNYRIRVLLYAGRPNWDLLPPSHPAEIRRAACISHRENPGVDQLEGRMMMSNEANERVSPDGFVVLSDGPALDGTDPLEFEAIAGRLERVVSTFAGVDTVHY